MFNALTIKWIGNGKYEIANKYTVGNIHFH